MLGYKAFKHDWTCKEFQYVVGQTYDMPAEEIQMCQRGFHLCQYPIDVFNYYNRSDDVYALVQAEDRILHDGDKSVTNRITIVKPLTVDELMYYMPEKIERDNGRTEWYRKGTWQLHRDNGPAIVDPDWTEEWYQNGRLHRDDGPAVTCSNGYKAWYQQGQRHRIDGPAITRLNGDRLWYQKGRLHREDGPAIESHDGMDEWYIHGSQVEPPVNSNE